MVLCPPPFLIIVYWSSPFLRSIKYSLHYLVLRAVWTCNSRSGSSQLHKTSCWALWPCGGVFVSWVILTPCFQAVTSTPHHSSPCPPDFFFVYRYVVFIYIFMNHGYKEPLLFVSHTEDTVLTLRDLLLVSCLFLYNFGYFVLTKYTGRTCRRTKENLVLLTQSVYTRMCCLYFAQIEQGLSL